MQVVNGLINGAAIALLATAFQVEYLPTGHEHTQPQAAHRTDDRRRGLLTAEPPGGAVQRGEDGVVGVERPRGHFGELAEPAGIGAPGAVEAEGQLMALTFPAGIYRKGIDVKVFFAAVEPVVPPVLPLMTAFVNVLVAEDPLDFINETEAGGIELVGSQLPSLRAVIPFGITKRSPDTSSEIAMVKTRWTISASMPSTCSNSVRANGC